MGLSLKLYLSLSYVARNTQNFCITANFIVLFLLRVMKGDILICYDYTALIYVNGKCKHKHIRPFLNF